MAGSIRIAVFVVLLIVGASLPQAQGASVPPAAESCAMCHTGDDDSAPKMRIAGYARSAHGTLDCDSCHEGASEMPHAEKLPLVKCSMCHEDAVLGVESSTHGKAMLKNTKGGVTGACLRCHGGTVHSILPLSNSKSPASRTGQVDLCGSCHNIPKKTPERIERRKPIESYLNTVHGLARVDGNGKAALCADCHGSHDVRTGADSASKVSRSRIVETCGRCHERVATVYRRSAHGRSHADGVKEAPTCIDCHGEHDVASVASFGSHVSSAAVSGTCAGCHADEHVVGKLGLSLTKVQSFKDSYHSLASQRGESKTANCSSCHGWHEILPANDPASSIHPDRLAQTCGACHPGAGAKFGSISVHSGLSGRADATQIAKLFRILYWILIPCVIGGMLFHNFADLMRKSLSGASLPPLKKHVDEDMLNVSERFQHAGLGISFIVLALTGFALEYPELGSWLGNEGIRRWTHRGAAVLFLFVGLYHGVYLLLTARGRVRLRGLLPAFRDAVDPIYLMLSNLGFKVDRPVLPRWSYIEKAEYWALIWGSFVMLVTGAVLAFDNFALAHFPLWVIESSQVIHFLEAVLACLAIIVWHWYWVIFDPHVYPMNWAWLTGREKWGEKKSK